MHPSKENPTRQDNITPPTTFLKTIRRLCICAILLGLAQLVSWLGLGYVDPFVGTLTILQFTCFLVFALQVVVWIPSTLLETEIFYDVTGSLTYLLAGSYTLTVGYQASVKDQGKQLDPHAFVATAMLFVWCIRLGYYLFSRALKYGDSRFVEIKTIPFRFLVVWFLQACWVMLGAIPVFIVNANHAYHDFTWTDVVGGFLFLVGLIIEVIADNQKANWRLRPEAKGRWIEIGLWYYSRHPNLFGEWMLQFGIFVFCASSFSGSQWIAVISPVFVFLLLRYVSGVPTLESKADERFKGNEEYERYKKNTSVCIPLPKLPPETQWTGWLI